MNTGNVSDLTDIVRKIEKEKILLPDFQRKFVWTDEKQQKMLVASVLSKMPIGSILLLKSKSNEYASKIIGCKKQVNIQDEDVEFLLDGQQRMTVLSNVFSDIIHSKCDKVSDLVSESLKRRFFLQIPKWESVYKGEVDDIFGLKEFRFKYENPDYEEPDFLSNDILKYIEVRSFLASDGKPYNPYVDLNTNLDNYCVSSSDGYLIPLFLLIPAEGKRKAQSLLRYNDIIALISESIRKEICNYWEIAEKDEKDKLLLLFFEDYEIQEITEDENIFGQKLREKEDIWTNYFKGYLTSCIKNVILNQIVVSEDKRDRAIDIYENLNRGGVSLNVFDLIMAKVAKVSNVNFFDRMIEYLSSIKTYSKDILPSKDITSFIDKSIDNKTLNASAQIMSYNKDKNEISPKFIDVFLDVLSLNCYNPKYDPNIYKVDMIKKEKILQLKPEEIDENTEEVIIAIDRAFFFLMTRCGIRKISEIKNNLMIVLIALLFKKDEWFFDKNVQDKVEAWYWSSVFSGEFDRNQNTVFIDHLQKMVKIISGCETTNWISAMGTYVLDSQNYSDKDFLLMKKVDEDRFPKDTIKDYFCQYMLSNVYVDLFNPAERLSVFSPNASDLEAHHIIPIGSIKKVGELSSYIRNNPKNIVNSPLNFVLITKASNKEILEDPLDVYIKKICPQAKAALYLTAYTNPNLDEDEISQILSGRFDFLKGAICNELQSLLC